MATTMNMSREKRWPALLGLLLFAVLCASAAYWFMQLFKPAARPVAAPPLAQASAPKTEAAASLFGGKGGAVANASNYQLKGLVLASSLADSVVILASDGKPAQAYRASREIAPGVTVKEVHPGYVVLSENGTARRVELPAELKGGSAAGTESPVRSQATGASASGGFAGSATPPPRTMPSIPTAAPTAGSAAAAATVPGAVSPANQQVPPGMPVPVNSGASGTAGMAGSGQGVSAPAQPPIMVNSPPTMRSVPAAGSMPAAGATPGAPASVAGQAVVPGTGTTAGGATASGTTAAGIPGAAQAGVGTGAGGVAATGNAATGTTATGSTPSGTSTAGTTAAGAAGGTTAPVTNPAQPAATQ